MTILPFEKLIIRSTMSEEEVLRRINSLLEPKKKFQVGVFGPVSYGGYLGELNDKKFNLRRNISYKNSFLPEIIGTVERVNGDTVVKVVMRPHIFIIIFLFFWCFAVGFGFITSLSHSNDANKVFSTILIPIGLIIFAYLLTMAGFKFESNKTKKDFNKLFEG
jgi:hypothetical protein